MTPNKSAIAAILLCVTTVPSFAQWTLEPLFTLAPGSRTYLPATGDNNQRGMDYNPVTGHLLLSDRTGGLFLRVLDGATGADLGTMNTTGITGGTFALNMIRVAGDGAIYGANLTTDSSSATQPLKIYRWADETAAPVLVYQGDPSNGDTATPSNRRYGDNFDVRGSGTGTQLLLASRAGTVATILTTADGINFSSTKISTTAPVGSMGLGSAFGDGETFLGDVTGAPSPTRLIAYDLAAGTGTLQTSYGTADSMGPIAYDAANKLIAGVSLNATPTKDTVLLYDVSSGSAVLQDTESFPLDQANGNGVGSLDFGNGRLYALDANNGIMAFTVTQVPEPGTVALGVLGLGAVVAGARRRK